MIKEAIILAGGLGTRLNSIVSDVPKPMAPIKGKPFLNYLLRYLEFYKVERVVLSLGHLHEVVSNHYGNKFQTIQLEYAVETEKLGTGGALRFAAQRCIEPHVLALNGDSFFDVNLFDFIKFHLNNHSDFSLALRQVNNAARYGKIEVDENNRINKFTEKNEKNLIHEPGLINGGIYLFNIQTFLKNTPNDCAFSLEKEYFEKKPNNISLLGLTFERYFIDIGIPTDYQKAQNEFEKFPY